MTEPEVFTLNRADLRLPSDCTTLITGGIAGIGLQTALLLHDLSPKNRIIIVDRADKIQCQAPQSFLSSSRVLFLQADITSWVAQRSAFEQGVKYFGSIDNVFVNAGVYEIGDQIFDETLDQDGKLKEPNRKVLDIDLNAAFDTIKLAAYYLQRRSDRSKGGSIVLTASLAGYLGTTGAPAYSASKHGIVGLLRTLKADIAKHGMSISLVAPGITLTELAQGRKEGESMASLAKRMRDAGVPVNDPEEVAAVVVWLMGQGQEANGKGVLIQAGKCADVERGIAINRKSWMSTTMVDLFKGGRNATLFNTKL